MLNQMKFGLAGGIVCGVFFFLATLIAIYTGHGAATLGMMKEMYPGYDLTIVGSFIGLIYGFIKSFVSFFVFAWLYNNLPVK